MLAHVKWFAPWSEHPTDYGLLLSPRMALAAGLALGVVLLAAVAERLWHEPAIFRRLDGLVRWGPFFVGTHAGLPLVVAAVTGRLFAPHLYVEQNALGLGLLAFELAVGALLVVGLFTRAAAVGLVFLGPLAALPFGFEGIVEQVHFLGIALFLFLIGRGPLALDRLRRPAGTPDARVPLWAVTMLRVLAGLSVAFTALTEKVLNPALSAALLYLRPELNVARGLGMDDASFALAAGAAEFAIGIWIASGQLTRVAIILAWFPFNATLLLFGWRELLGHFPIFGIMFLLLVAANVGAPHVRRGLQREAAAA